MTLRQLIGTVESSARADDDDDDDDENDDDGKGGGAAVGHNGQLSRLCVVLRSLNRQVNGTTVDQIYRGAISSELDLNSHIDAVAALRAACTHSSAIRSSKFYPAQPDHASATLLTSVIGNT